MTTHPALDRWLESHPYLKGIAGFHRCIDNALYGQGPTDVPPPNWESYAEAFEEGIPMLRSRPLDKAVIAHAGALFIRFLERMSERKHGRGKRDLHASP
jgi:hypothetical protein